MDPRSLMQINKLINKVIFLYNIVLYCILYSNVTEYKARKKISDLSSADKKSAYDKNGVISGENCHQNSDYLHREETEHRSLASESDSIHKAPTNIIFLKNYQRISEQTKNSRTACNNDKLKRK